MDWKGLLKKWYDVKLKHKLIFIFSILIIIPIIVIQYFALGIIKSRMDAAQQKQVEYIKNSISNLLLEYKTKSTNYIKFLKGEQSIVDTAFIATYTADTARLVTELKKHKEALDINTLEIIDATGKVIGRGHNIEKSEDNKAGKYIFKEAIAGNVVAGIDEENGVYSINAAGPIIREEKPLAVIMSGIHLDNAFVQRLKELTGAEIILLFNNEIKATTFAVDGNSLERVYKAVNKVQPDKIKDIEIGNISYDAAVIDLKKSNNSISGRAYIAVSRHDIGIAQRNMRVTLLIITAFSLLIAVGIGYIIAGKIASQLSKGVSFAQVVSQGNLKEKIEIDTNDEIGVLGKSLNKMAENLKAIINKIRASAANISEAAAHVNAEQLAKSAAIESESVEDITTSIFQMSTSIKGVAESAEGLSQVADESSASILEMTASINQIAQSTDALSNAVENTSSAISEMSVSIKQISENIDILSSASEQTASAVNEISTTIKSVEGNVNESTMLSEKVKKDASELGIKAIDKTVGGMNKIKESVAATSLIINKLGERSQQIGKILTVIDDVTDQTNLLALNAAIIAAQAGEHGRGFAVVADEIKDLAERTSASTKEIAQMIESMQKGVEDAVAAMEGSSENVVEGMNLSKEAGSALSKILESADKSAQMSKEIERATKEQSKGLSQVNEAVQRITNMVREIAHATQEQRKGSDQIISSVEKMRDVSRQVRQATIEQTKGSKQINDAVENVNHKVHSIVKATKEQKTGSEQIVHAIEKIREITKQNSSLSSELKGAVDLLLKEADILNGEVRQFVI